MRYLQILWVQGDPTISLAELSEKLSQETGIVVRVVQKHKQVVRGKSGAGGASG